MKPSRNKFAVNVRTCLIFSSSCSGSFDFAKKIKSKEKYVCSNCRWGISKMESCEE